MRYPTFNIQCQKLLRNSKVDSYLAGEHTESELMNYAHYGFWKSKNQYTRDESTKLFIENNPSGNLQKTLSTVSRYSVDEFRTLVKQALELKPERCNWN